MILEPPSKSQMDVLNVASQTVIKSLLSFFEELGMMGKNIKYPPTFEEDGLAGYRTYFEDDWKEFDFSKENARFTKPTIRQTVQELAQKKNLIGNPRYPSYNDDIAGVDKQLDDLLKRTDNPILLIQTQSDYIWGFYYNPKISFIGEFKDVGDNSYYLEVSHAVKFAISLNRPNSVYIKTPIIYNRCFDRSCFHEIFSSPNFPNALGGLPRHKLVYNEYQDYQSSTTYTLSDSWNSYKTKIFQGFRDTKKDAMFLYLLGPKPTSLMNWNSVPWDNNFK